MELLEQWRNSAYSQEKDSAELNKLWDEYFALEKGIYEQLLADPDVEVKGTVKELAEKYNMELLTMVGFLDGINDSLKVPNPIETMTEDTVVSLAFDKEMLYRNMVGAKSIIHIFNRGIRNFRASSTKLIPLQTSFQRNIKNNWNNIYISKIQFI